MAVILHTTRSIARSGVRLVSLRQLVLLVCFIAMILSGLSFWAGIVFGHFSSRGDANGISGVQHNIPQENFTIDRLGDMSGRLLRLESDARSLVKKLSAIETLESKLGDLRAGKFVATLPIVDAGRASGGKALAPQVCSPELLGTVSREKAAANAEQTMRCLQQILTRVGDAAAQRSLSYMSLPTHQPVEANRLGSTFGNRADPFTGNLAFHSGIDFAADIGTPIRSAGAGKVKNASWMSDLGNLVEIDHGNGLITRYAHASRIFVKVGDLVTPGQLIAAVGTTGRSTGPHLHFEVIHNGQYVDPMPYLSLGAAVPNV